MVTFQDFLQHPNPESFLAEAVDDYRRSEAYNRALLAERYYNGNTRVTSAGSIIDLGGGKLDLAAIRTPSAIFKRLTVQLVQTVWAYGAQMDDAETKSRLGPDFDYIASWISENAVIHGVCYGFWNLNRLQMLTALEYLPLPDERDGSHRAGIRFYQIGEGKPEYIQLFEADGYTEYLREKSGGKPVLHTAKRPYKLRIRDNALNREIIDGENYGALPVVPLYANKRHQSEFTRPIQNKIDLMDFILSGFGDEVLRTKAIYWVLQGFGGTLEKLKEIRGKVEQSGIIATGDGTTADTKTVELPHGAVEYALEKLENDIYRDFMGMNTAEITGGSLTNVAIETARENLNLKASDFEWQVFDFCRRVLLLQGISTENIRFKRRELVNKMEVMRMLSLCRNDLDLRTALEKNPLVEPDEVDVILQRKACEEAAQP